ncbi:MAG: hypothetical protein ACI8VL_000939, partial [Bacteroidia bacterium]
SVSRLEPKQNLPRKIARKREVSYLNEVEAMLDVRPE